jgi:phosphoribosylformimino-5-aminoimidazole carboxamide ribotide isomerase
MSARLYPAIDLLAGKGVRLHRGERATAKVYADDPPAQARAFARQGARLVHVVDLDAAFGEPRQLGLIRAIAQAARSGGAEIEVGGGVRDLAAVEATLDAGAARVILGTAAIERPELAGEAVQRCGAESIAVGIDVKDGRAAVRGWVETGGPPVPELAARLQSLGVRWLVVTAVARDGTLGGFDLDLFRAVAKAAPQCKLVASGGAGALEHLSALRSLRSVHGAIAGTALYENKFTVPEGMRALGEPPRWLGVKGDYAVSCDADTLEPTTIHGYLTRSYWAEGIPLETVTRSLDNSLNFSLVHLGGSEPRQVGFARVITDKATFAYLGDVFVLENHRGRHLAPFLMECVMAHPDVQGLRRFLLFTRDAHHLYWKHGFRRLSAPDRAMEKVNPEVYVKSKPALDVPELPGAVHAGDEDEA